MKIFFLSFLFLWGISTFSQVEIKGKILDAQSGETIPYANVYLKNQPVGTTAFRDGSFKLHLDSMYNDSLVISIIGYENKFLFLPDVGIVKNLNVKLEPKQEELLEVEVKPKKMESLEIGLLKNRANHETGAAPEKPSARFIPNELQLDGFIKNVAVYISKKGVPEAPFRLNVLMVDKSTGAPGKPLIFEDFIINAEKGNEWVVVDLEKKLVPFPSEGIFVAVQPLPIDSIHMVAYRAKYPEITEGWMLVSAPKFGYNWEKYEEAAIANWDFGWTESREWRPQWRDLYEKLDSSRNVASQRASSLMIKAEINYYADQNLKVKDVKTKGAIKKVFDRPKENTLKYPQSSPQYLLSSLIKAFEADDLAYICNYLVYYEDKEELEETMAFLENQADEAGKVSLSEKEKKDVIELLNSIRMQLQKLKPSEENRFVFELKHDKVLYYFQNKNGTWKINPRSTSLVKPSVEMKIPVRL